MRHPGRLPLEQLEPFLLTLSPADPASPPPVLDWQVVFGNTQPVEIEVGFGKGLFLLNAAGACPDVNFLGVEVERKYVLFTATRIAKRGLRNVKLAHADARSFLREGVADGAVAAVHVYFPDPWWKKRHHKRRVFKDDFARQCTRILKAGGKLHIVTDVEEYYGIITGLMSTVEGMRALPPPEPHGPAHDLDYLTNFERKFRKEGKAIYRALYERVDTPSSGSGRAIS